MPDDAPDTTSVQSRDYRETIFLPQTAFPMRGGLPQLEPKLLEAAGDLYGRVRAVRQAAGRCFAAPM